MSPPSNPGGPRPRAGRLLLSSWLVLGLLAGGAAVAAAQSHADQYTGCLAQGMLSQVAVGDAPTDDSCRRGEQVTWNAAGVPGPRGATGATGPAGPPGPQGPAGDTVPATRWYRDADGDGFGDFYAFLDSAAQPDRYVDNNLDCQDLRPSMHPDVGLDDGSSILPDGDCDGEAGEDVLLSWYRDGDGDGYGVASERVERRRSEGPQAGFTLNAADCDDGDASLTPYSPACQGVADAGSVSRDLDGDGHAAIVAGGDDCDDFDVARYPFNIEVRDARGHDEDCDLLTTDVVPYDPGWLDPRLPAPASTPQSALQQRSS